MANRFFYHSDLDHRACQRAGHPRKGENACLVALRPDNLPIGIDQATRATRNRPRMLTEIGQVEAIFRYPVKSMGGERLEVADLGWHGISQYRYYVPSAAGVYETSFYIYDGHGSVRGLSDPNGNVTDTYDYDAFGNETHSSTTLCITASGTVTTVALGAACSAGSTPSPTLNEFLFAGEQYDSDLHLYYNRARYLNVTTGRFWTMDTFESDDQSPLSLHKYLYVAADPTNVLDPSGNQLDEEEEADAISVTADSMSDLAYARIIKTFYSILFRVPQIVQAVEVGVTALGAAASAAAVLQELGHNLLENTQPYSSVPTALGFQVGQYAGQNLANNFPHIDDFQDGVATQIKSTTQVQTADQLLRVVRSAAQDLNNLPPELTGQTASGQTIRIVTATDIQAKNLLVVIPSKPYDFDLRAVMEEIQEIANSGKINIALQEIQNLEGPP